MKNYILILLLSCLWFFSHSQGKNVNITSNSTQITAINPPAKNLFKNIQTSKRTSSVQSFTTLSMDDQSSNLRVRYNNSEDGSIWLQGTPVSMINLRSASVEVQVKAYLNETASFINVDKPEDKFSIVSIHTDKLGIRHIRLQQHYKGIPIEGAELMIHGKSDLNRMNGKSYRQAIDLDILPTVSIGEVKDILLNDNPRNENWNDPWGIMDMDKEKSQLIIFPTVDGPKLAYRIDYHPSMVERWKYIVDAHSGDIIEKHQSICKFHNLHLHESEADGPSITSAPDLFGSDRSINTYEISGGFYMIDGSRTMYDAVNSVMPNEPVGVIWTIDAFNTSPERNDFFYDHVFSSDNLWSGQQTQVSAHYNAGKTYEYFKNTHSRESISGSGNNIISLVNIADSDGSSLENAFWNGVAMFYGNGGNAFEPLARGLDVAAHEISHGVIQNTANLEYMGESGALNESYADVFGVLVDRDDYLVGEDVVKPAAFPSGALRSMVDPHNGAATGDYNGGFQPKHVSEMYLGSQDNGGVHINSGIPNHAFYLFAQAVGKEKAENVYYHTLTNYLLKSSKFIDQRLAVIQSATDLYGNAEAQAAANAFDAVGITDGQGGNYQEDEEVNPGSSFLLVADGDRDNLWLYNNNLQILNSGNPFSQTNVISKPSITDDGEAIFFVDDEFNIKVILIDWEEGSAVETYFQQEPQGIFRNVIVSKDGRRIAALLNEDAPRIYVYDFGVNQDAIFELYNPTFTEDIVTNEVRYADAMEFDFSGEFIVYDALNEITSTSSGQITYWDIGFIRVWNNQENYWSLGSVEKLFSALPSGVSVANPTFSKNSDYIISFEAIYQGIFDLYGANLQTGDLNLLFSNSTINYPNFNSDDSRIVVDLNLIGPYDLGDIQLDATKINTIPSSERIILEDSRWGVWFANGSRDFSSSIEEQELELIRSYPNPTQDILNVGFISASTGMARIEIFGLNGKRVASENVNAIIGSNHHTINVGSLNEGMYLCRIISSGKTGSFLFFKK